MSPTPTEGIRFLDHTADVGIEVHAPSLELLFHRAAVAMLLLLQGADDDDPDPDGPDGSAGDIPPSDGAPAAEDSSSRTGAGVRRVEASGDGSAALLADWLRELLHLHGSRGVDYARATFDRLTETALEARVRTVPAAPAVREIKGVTYHGLSVEPTDDGWRGRVIFDV